MRRGAVAPTRAALQQSVLLRAYIQVIGDELD